MSHGILPTVTLPTGIQGLSHTLIDNIFSKFSLMEVFRVIKYLIIKLYLFAQKMNYRKRG